MEFPTTTKTYFTRKNDVTGKSWDNIKEDTVNILTKNYPIKKTTVRTEKHITKVKTEYFNKMTDINYKLFGLVKTRNKLIDTRFIAKFFNTWKRENKENNIDDIIKIKTKTLLS